MECPIYLNVVPAEPSGSECGQCGIYKDRLCVNEPTVMRRHSMPSPFRLSLSSNDLRNTDELRRVRSFRTTSKGVVNSGDILRKRGSVSVAVTSGHAVTTLDTELSASSHSLQRLHSTASLASSADQSFTSSGAPSYYRVLVLGASGVGKSALIKQFMSSENSSSDDSFAMHGAVSVMLDDEESLLEFCNFPDEQYPEEDVNVDAYVVVYSITDNCTYDYAVRMVKYLRQDLCLDRPIIVVANKADLVRKRTVDKNDARLYASYHDCKYVETSATLNHHVDDLLAGIISQIRLKLNPDKLLKQIEKMSLAPRLKRRHGSLKSARSILHRLFNKQKSLSCDNLYDL